jgi:hypothetical protein
MFITWGTYFKPLHLNNTSGMGIINGNVSNATTTPIVVTAESDGKTYMPNSTQLIDVYSGGAPFTLTQELVQRGAEVQEDMIEIAVIGSSPSNCMQIVQTIRTALTYQEYTGPQILKIKHAQQTTYTEWLIHSAIIQEKPETFGRDLKNYKNPIVYLQLKITRSPYASDSSYSSIGSIYPFVFQNSPIQVLNSTTSLPIKSSLGSMLNVDINFDLTTYPTYKLGPIAFGIASNDTFNTTTTTTSGTITAGNTYTYASSLTYNVRDNSNVLAPLQIAIVMASVQSNEIEIRASIKGYNTPYVRAVGTQINSSNGTNRLFMLPPIDINNIFNGYPDYYIGFNLPVQIQLRNINRGASRTFQFAKIFMYRSNQIVQLFPTSDWTSRTEKYISYNLISFYNQIEFPAQPLPFFKSFITTTTRKERYTFSEGCEIRGTNLRVADQSGTVSCFAYIMDSTCSYVTYNDALPNDYPLIQMIFTFSSIYESLKG